MAPETRFAPSGRSLVLGAGGFLGGHVARWLTGAGAPVRLLDLSVRTLPPSVVDAPGCEVVQTNLMDDTDLRRALDGVAQVFHLVSATVPSTSVDQVDVEIDANVLPTVRLLRAMRDVGVPRLVFPSSGGTIYGRRGGDDAPTTESAALAPTNSYGLGKLLIEEILRFHAGHGGPDFVALRISNIYGPSTQSHRRQGVINAFLHEAKAGRPLRIWGDGSTVRDYVYVDDVLDAMAAVLAEGTRNEAFNLGSGVGVSVAEIVELVREVTGLDVQIQREPAAYAGVDRNVLDASRLTAATGWRPKVDLREGMERTWRSVREAD